MANAYTALYYHVVFSTKNRMAYIKPEIESRVSRLHRRRGAVAQDDGVVGARVQSSLTRRGNE